MFFVCCKKRWLTEIPILIRIPKLIHRFNAKITLFFHRKLFNYPVLISYVYKLTLKFVITLLRMKPWQCSLSDVIFLSSFGVIQLHPHLTSSGCCFVVNLVLFRLSELCWHPIHFQNSCVDLAPSFLCVQLLISAVLWRRSSLCLLDLRLRRSRSHRISPVIGWLVVTLLVESFAGRNFRDFANFSVDRES